MTLPRDDAAPTYEALTFQFSGVIVRCWRCHDEIELLVEEDPKADHLCADCDAYYQSV